MNIKKHILSILLFLTFYTGYGQLTIQLLRTPQLSIPRIFTRENGGIEIQDCQYIGHAQSVGHFINKTTCFEIPRGLVLSTGMVYSISMPNMSGNSGESLGTNGDFDLSLLSHGRTFDASVIILDFVSSTDSISFSYFFGSEEYPEFLNKGVNDVFAFFIRKKGTKSWHNIAFSPTGVPITIDNINHTRNKEYYIQNRPYNPKVEEQSENQREIELSRNFTFDGFITPMLAVAHVEPMESYELKITIADVGDDIYDSGVFLAANSFQALHYIPPKQIALELPAALIQLPQKLQNMYVVSSDTANLTITLYVRFGFDSYQIDSLSATILDVIARHLWDKENTVNLFGHTDSIGTAEYNTELSLHRAESVAQYLIEKRVSHRCMTIKGLGATMPQTSNTSEEGRIINRRVDIQIQLSE